MPNDFAFFENSFQNFAASVAAKENFNPVFARVAGPRDRDRRSIELEIGDPIARRQIDILAEKA